MIKLPAKVSQTMEALTNHGFQVYAVGGCVRDALLGKEPLDWDLTTDARLWNLEEIFPEAEMLHYLDMIDARMYDMQEALNSTMPGQFSDRVFTLDNRRLYKKEGSDK